MPRQSLKFVLAFAVMGAALSLQADPVSRGFKPQVSAAHAGGGTEYCQEMLSDASVATEVMQKTKEMIDDGSSKSEITDAICEDLRTAMWGLGQFVGRDRPICREYISNSDASDLNEVMDVLRDVNDEYCQWKLGV